MPFTNLYPGVSTSSAGLGLDMPLFNPIDQVVFFDDFFKYLPSATDWVLTETQAGATQAQTSGHGGRLLLTNSAADNDLVSLQHAPTSIAMAAGRRAWMATRFQISDATQTDVFIGLAATDTSPIASVPSDYVAFTKDDESTALNLKTAGSSASILSLTSLGTATAATDVTLGMYYDGVSRLYVYVNNALVSTTNAAFASLFPTAVMSPIFALQNGDANARTMNIDYLLIATDR